MHQLSASRRLAGIVATLLCVVGAHASDYPNDRWGGHPGYALHENARLHREIDEMSDQMRRQQRRLDQHVRQQQEQNRLLQQERISHHKLTARQACHYRLTGGLDICDHLFDKTSKQHTACVQAANDMNEACAEPGRRAQAER